MSGCAVCSFCGRVDTPPRMIVAPSHKALCLDCADDGDLIWTCDRIRYLEQRMGKGHGLEHFVAKRLGWLLQLQKERRARGGA